MLRWLTCQIGAEAERRVLDSLPGVGAVAVTALFAAVSLGFSTFAAYSYLRALEGSVVASLIVCLGYAFVAIAIGAIGLAHRRARRLRSAAAAPASHENVDLLLQSLAATAAPQDQAALLAAMRAGRELSPFQLLALALVGGFVVGRKLK